MANIYQQVLQDKVKKPRRSRNSIPKVNPNPQPPNSHVGGPRLNPTQQAIKNAVTPNDPGELSSYQPAPGAIDPRDSQYWNTVANLIQTRNQGLRQSQMESTYGRTGFESQQQALTAQEPLDIQLAREQANRQGTFYSSRTSEDIGNLVNQYFTTLSGNERQYQQEESLRKLARDAIRSGYRHDEAAALIEAVHRQAQNEINRPVPSPATKPPPTYQDILDQMKMRGDISEPKGKPPKGGKGGKGGGGHKSTAAQHHHKIKTLQHKLRKANNPHHKKMLRKRIRRLQHARP